MTYYIYTVRTNITHSPRERNSRQSIVYGLCVIIRLLSRRNIIALMHKRALVIAYHSYSALAQSLGKVEERLMSAHRLVHIGRS